VNTPGNEGRVSLSYAGAQGVDASLSAYVSEAFNWFGGNWGTQRVPARHTVNITGGYQLTPKLRVHAVGTNVLNQRRYHMFGGSVIGRRLLAGMTAAF
jgi:outer membrane receptor protein involved in Fe transport